MGRCFFSLLKEIHVKPANHATQWSCMYEYMPLSVYSKSIECLKTIQQYQKKIICNKNGFYTE